MSLSHQNAVIFVKGLYNTNILGQLFLSQEFLSQEFISSAMEVANRSIKRWSRRR